MSPSWAQVGPKLGQKLGPSWLQVGPTWAQVGFKLVPSCEAASELSRTQRNSAELRRNSAELSANQAQLISGQGSKLSSGEL